MKEIYVTKPFLPPIEEYISEINNIWESNILTNGGPEYKKFRNALKDILKVNNIALFTNGHLALETAIRALNLTGEVITTPFTFISTTHAIVNNNLTPVFCDIKMDDYTIDEEKIEALITERTSAIIPVHVYGYPCNVEKIEEIAKKHNLKVIYDAAHAFGVEINGKSIFECGDASMCSMHATKVFNTIEGGFVVSDKESLSTEMEKLKNYGILDSEHIDSTGINGKMSEFQAAMGLVSLKYLDSIINRRKELTNKYRTRLSKIKGIKLYKEKENIKYNYAYMPILIDDEYGLTRDALYEELKKNNIFSRKYFYPLTSNVECYDNKYKNTDLETANYVADRILTLPLYSELEDEEIEKIITVIKRGEK